MNATEIKSRLYTEGCPDIDVLVRTSGETRLSDFMVYQVRGACASLTPTVAECRAGV